MDTPSLQTSIVGTILASLLGMVGFSSRRKAEQIDEHLELVDKRLNLIEQNAITRTVLNYELDKAIRDMNARFDELKQGHVEINKTLMNILRDRGIDRRQ